MPHRQALVAARLAAAALLLTPAAAQAEPEPRFVVAEASDARLIRLDSHTGLLWQLGRDDQRRPAWRAVPAEVGAWDGEAYAAPAYALRLRAGAEPLLLDARSGRGWLLARRQGGDRLVPIGEGRDGLASE